MPELYTTTTAMTERFGEQLLIRLTVDNPDGYSVINTAVLGTAISAVDGVISSYLRSVYTLPLSELPDELERAAQDLVIGELYSNKPERETPKDVLSRCTAATNWLKDIKKGLATLSVATLPPAPGTNTETGGGFFRSNKQASDRLFSDSVLNSFTGGRSGN